MSNKYNDDFNEQDVDNKYNDNYNTQDSDNRYDETYTYSEKNYCSDKYNINAEQKSGYCDDVELGEKNNTVLIKKGTKTFLITSVIVLLLLVSLLAGYFIYSINNGNGINFPNITSGESQNQQGDDSASQNNASINLEEIPSDTNQMSAGQVYEKVAPSVVGVVVYDSQADIFSDPIGKASGVIISEDGYIVTNSHVVGDSTKYGVKIVLNTSEELSGKIVGIDKKTDLAVIKAEKTGLTKATFADSDQVKVGDWALAIGNPGAGDISFDSSLTRGIVSALNRSLGGSQRLVKYIQTDAPINSGNSGGPLLNMYGQVIGINSVKLVPSNYEGMGFAIPANTVKSIVDSIISNGYVSGRVVLGISGQMVSAYQAQMYNVPMGVIIAKVNSDSDIKDKGVKTGDIIMKVNDINVTGFDVLSNEISKYKVGESVKLTIYRPSGDRSNYSTFDINVKLMEDKGDIDPDVSSKIK